MTERSVGVSESALPNLFVVGAPKCGTTAFCDMLNQHSEIFVPEVSEPGFLSADLTRPDRVSFERYLSLYCDSRVRYRVDASTEYLRSEKAPALLVRANPNAKAIVLIRDPIRLTYSLFRYRRFTGIERCTSFEQVLEREVKYLDRVGRWGVPLELSLLYTELAFFSDGIERYRKFLGNENLLVLLHEDLAGNHQSVIERAYEFLDLRAEGPVVNRRVNVTGAKRSERFGELIANRPGWVDSIGYRLPKFLRSNAYALAARLNTSYAPAEPIEPRTFERLREHFRRDVDRCARLLKRDLSHWMTQ